jgi:predicted acyl esterase
LEPTKKSLTNRALDSEKAIRIDGPKESVTFDLPIEKDSELIGYSKLRLWVQLHDSTDQDIHVVLERLNRFGIQIADRSIPLPNIAIETGLRLLHRTGIQPELGLVFPQTFKGSLRLSHRELEASQSKPERPFLSHRLEMPVKPGEIIPVDIAIDPVALKLSRGETLRIRIAGRNLAPIPLKGLKHDEPKGSAKFSIWCGGKFDSHLLMPLRSIAKSV